MKRTLALLLAAGLISSTALGTDLNVSVKATANDTNAVTVGPGDPVQFYVEGQDALGATSTYPADGADSRALIQFNDGRSAWDKDNFRIIMTAADSAILHSSTLAPPSTSWSTARPSSSTSSETKGSKLTAWGLPTLTIRKGRASPAASGA